MVIWGFVVVVSCLVVEWVNDVGVIAMMRWKLGSRSILCQLKLRAKSYFRGLYYAHTRAFTIINMRKVGVKTVDGGLPM